MTSHRVIPIFPLPVVQFPNAITPLHIFEPRYRKMLKDVMEKDKAFGVIYRPSVEDSALPPVADRVPLGSVGCIVEVAVVQELPDGRSNILCVGGARFRLLQYIEGEQYLQAEIVFFEDEPNFEDLTVEAERAKTAFNRLLAANRKIKDDRETEEDEVPDLPNDPQALSFIVTAYLDIEPSQKQELLEMIDTGERLREVARVIETLAGEYEKRAIIHHVAKKNGHGGKPRDI
ncbi:MAG TPA: LON peptidase substrate-binding domain-containing protein [Blastocatellia bacterium]|jgi:Lon protease-like protein|nr:LON peptidase substrate-binding domain-containing protein [Blastocatellia bacterium]